MDRIEYINERVQDRYLGPKDAAIVNALVHALSPEDACDFLDLTFQQEYHVRRYLLRKISHDISSYFTASHKKLLSQLYENLSDKKFPRKETCSYCLDFLYDSLPSKEKNKLLTFFLSSKSIRNRDRAYKKIKAEWNNKHKIKIVNNWNQFKDPYCLGIIVDYFPVEYLIENHTELMNHCAPFQRPRLFLKIAKEVPELLNKLREIDQISYAYVLVKLKKTLSESEAKEILKNNNQDEARIGLLIWCFGQMGLWDAIIDYDQNFK